MIKAYVVRDKDIVYQVFLSEELAKKYAKGINRESRKNKYKLYVDEVDLNQEQSE